MNINIGELNKRISVVTISTIQNENGFEEEQETEYCKTWAKVSNISGTEVFKNGADYSKTVTRFIVRYRKDKPFYTTLKIRFNNNLYNIVYVNNYNMSNEFIELVAEVVTNG
jgi:SPP1 family predicted phage head-tail adaptor